MLADNRFGDQRAVGEKGDAALGLFMVQRQKDLYGSLRGPIQTEGLNKMVAQTGPSALSFRVKHYGRAEAYSSEK